MNNINIECLRKLDTPYNIKNKYNVKYDDILFINNTRNTISSILKGQNKKKLVIVGPCSIHDYELCIDYAKRLKDVMSNCENLFIVLRMYFEKPRTIAGWKGYLYDPNLDGSNNIEEGLVLVRKLLLEVTRMRIPIATEFLDTIIPQYIDDLISFGCIGARTTESQLHRQLASGLSMPIGFKNRTDGNVEIAMNAILSAKNPHTFMGVDINGSACIVTTNGNNSLCVVLRGDCVNGSNIKECIMEDIVNKIEEKNINNNIIVDVSHDNTLVNGKKDYRRQIDNIKYLKNCWDNNKYENVIGIMIESNLKEGKQNISNNIEYGVSITDGCIDFESTQMLLNLLNK
tara:strand:- start:3488 stop:4519 length:1032 start_codon:yes stop_codon:yes gene_type:complete